MFVFGLRNLKILRMSYRHYHQRVKRIMMPDGLQELYFCKDEEKSTANLRWMTKFYNLKLFSLKLGLTVINLGLFSKFLYLEELYLEGISLNVERFPKHLNSLRKVVLCGVVFLKRVDNLFVNINPEAIEINECEFKAKTDLSVLISSVRSVRKLTIKLSSLNIDYRTVQEKSLSVYLNTELNYCLAEKVRMRPIVNDFIPSIIELSLTKNSLDSVYSHSFLNLCNLQKLIISNNQLCHLSNGIFDGLNNLKYLDLSDNTGSIRFC